MNRAVLDSLRREHLLFFLMRVFAELNPGEPPLELAWYLEALCHALDTAARKPGGRLAVAIPPRHTKSLAASVALSAWLLGHDPTLKIMVATYADKLAREHAQNCRQVMQSDWYKALFPHTRIADEGSRMLELVTTRGGGRRAVTVGGSVTGLGADLIIVDDCLKAEEARSEARREEVRFWFDGTLMTRLNHPSQGSVISIAQRLHEDDIYAHLVDKGYDTLCLPAITEQVEVIPLGGGRFHRREIDSLLDRPKYGRAVLDKLKRDMGSQVFSAQYQQNPVAPGGNLVEMAWFPTFEKILERDDYQSVVQSWDTASSEHYLSDFTVGLTFGYREKAWHLIDVVRERVDFPDLRRAVLRAKRRWQPDEILIEDANSGKSLWQEFRSSGDARPIMCKPEGGKEERLIGITGQLEAGMLRLPEEAPWLDAFRKELRAFPYGKHDDQVDALSQFFNYTLLRGQHLLEPRHPVTGRKLRINRPKRIDRSRR